MKRSLWLSLWLTLFSATVAVPCGFHNYAPQPTIVEQMLSSNTIVLARQSRHSPFKFEVTETLSGVRPDTPIPFLVDGTTRRKLKNKEVSVLFAYHKDTQTWSRLAIVDQTLRLVLNDILEDLPAWRSGATRERAQSFANLLNHPNRTIRTLALRELDLVGYDVLRTLSFQMDTQVILNALALPMERNREPIRVLLLGLSKDLNVAGRLAQGVEASKLGIGPYLGAYATAWIELTGVDAVETLARNYLVAPGITPSAQKLIVEAFALHRNYGDPEISTAVSQEMIFAIQKKPALATLAAQYFIEVKGTPDQRSPFGQKTRPSPWQDTKDEAAYGN